MSTTREATFDVVRDTVQPGRTLSEEAMEALGAEVLAFAASVMAHHWKTTGEPPTVVRLEVTATAS